jgi:hypothetical protein
MNALPLPDALRADLDSGRRPLSAEQKTRLGELLKAVETPFPDLYDFDGIRGANRLWTSTQVHFYLGQKSTTYGPGDIDPKLAVIIGQAEPDGPIALDYRVSPPRVVYLGTVNGQSLWIEISPDYETLVAAIARPRSG